MAVPAVAKSKFSSRFIKYMSGSPPGSLRFHCKWEKISSRGVIQIFQNFLTRKIWSFLYWQSAKTDCQCLLNHKFTCPRKAGEVPAFQTTLLRGLGLLNQVIFAPKVHTIQEQFCYSLLSRLLLYFGANMTCLSRPKPPKKVLYSLVTIQSTLDA